MHGIKRFICFTLILFLIAANVFAASSALSSALSKSTVAPPSPTVFRTTDRAESILDYCGELNLLVGDSSSLPDGCKSSDPGIAVCSEGTLSAIAPGQTRITYINDNKYQYWTLTVSDYQPAIAPMGRKLQLETAGVCTEWSCDNTAVATVDSSGSVTPVAVGDCIIRTSDENGSNYGWKISVKRAAYITIDDWPNDYTLDILATLKKYNVKATFFLCSQKNHLEKYQLIINEGHAIGNHTRTHNNLYDSRYSMYNSVKSMDKWLKENYNVTTKLLRYPGGFKGSQEVYRESYALLKKDGYRVFDWTCIIEDVRCDNAADAFTEFKKLLDEDVEIILMHNSRVGAGALEDCIVYMQENDYVCLPLDEQTPTFVFSRGWEE